MKLAYPTMVGTILKFVVLRLLENICVFQQVNTTFTTPRFLHQAEENYSFPQAVFS